MDKKSVWAELLAGRKAAWWALGFGFFFTVGSVGHYLPATRSIMLAITPWFLLGFGVLAVTPVAVSRNERFFVWGAVAFVFTFLLEALGVRTGRIFGEYSYGQTLGLKLFAVPLVIGFNWLIVVAGLNSLIENLKSNRWVRSVTAATGAVLFDLILEPVAMRFDYWNWGAGRVPLQNYIAWWLIAFLVSLAYHGTGVRTGTRIQGTYVIVQAIFLTSLLPLAL